MSATTDQDAPVVPPQPSDRPRPSLLARVGDLAFRRRWTVVAGWLVALIATTALSMAFKGEFKADYTARGSDSRAAVELLADRFPARSGDSIDVVLRSDAALAAPAARRDVAALLARIGSVAGVTGVDDPYATPGSIAPDGRTLLTHARLDVENPNDFPVARTKEIIAAATAATHGGFDVELGGQTVSQAQQGQVGSEGIGIAVAAVILLLTFGSVIAAGLPLVVALVGLAVSSALVGLVAAVLDVPDWSTSLAAMMGIGVGIDYVLLMVTRYREFRAAGLDDRRAAVAAIDTAGRSVLVAGSTVVISLVGLAATGLTAMRGAAVVTIFAVLLVMISTVTLLPALLSIAGRRIDSWQLPGRHVGRTSGSPAWAAWSRLVQRRAPVAAGLGVAILLALAAPVLGVRFGFPDASNDRSDRTTRQAYELVAAGFGAGANGPLLLAAELPAKGDTSALQTLTGTLGTTPGVASVAPVVLNPAGDTAVLTVVPTTGPQDKATERLVKRLRNDVIPTVTGNGTRIHVGGMTAGAIDSTAETAGKLPLLIGGVVGLSMLLLLVVFRSVVVAVKAAVMNLLSIGAAYGVVAYTLQGGWFGQLFGIETPTPLPAFIPVLMFAILFGLSMDYEVFLLSRIREFWVAGANSSDAVASGLSASARVITAAAAIMVAVFGAFVPSPEVFLKVIGIGLATAILVDATVVRMLLVPAVMQLLGRANWWVPAWLEQRLPQVHVEGHPERHLAGSGRTGTIELPGPRTEGVPVLS